MKGCFWKKPRAAEGVDVVIYHPAKLQCRFSGCLVTSQFFSIRSSRTLHPRTKLLSAPILYPILRKCPTLLSNYHTYLRHSPTQNPTRRFIARQRLSPCWLLATLMPVKPLLLPGDARWAPDPSYKHLGL